MIDANKFMKGKRRIPTVCFPNNISKEDLPLWGYYHEESNYYNVIDTKEPSSEMGGSKPILLGHFYEVKPDQPNAEDKLIGYYEKKIKVGSEVLSIISRPIDITSARWEVSSEDVAKIEGNRIISIKEGVVNMLLKQNEEEIFNFEFNVVPKDKINPKLNEIKLGDCIELTIKDEPTFVTSDNKICELTPVELKIDIFSRNTGILESDIMLKKGAIIIGCGSVGSLVAMELARAGVGRFFLIDMDVMGYHNICRHQCGMQDVGKYKVLAVKERILQINPSAEVLTSTKMIQEVALDVIEPFCGPDTIIVGCADNREGDLYADSMLAKPFKMPFVSIGFWERAFAGEIFYCLPEGMPAYSDFVAALGDTSGRVNANTHLYMGEVGSFEPGISADINFVTTVGVKMILDLLNRDNENYTQRLIHHLSQYTLICNTNNPKIGGEMAEIFSYPLQVTTSIEVEYANLAQ